MNERVWRWKGRIGSLKWEGGLLFVLAALLTVAGIINLSTVLNNPTVPQEVTLAQLVNGDIATSRYVSVSGLAAYDLGYEKTAGGKTTETYYFLIDPSSGDMVLVQHAAVLAVPKEANAATITGMTRPIPADLQEAMKEDETLFARNDLKTTMSLYIEDGAQPPTTASSVVMLALGLIGVGIGSIPFFLPHTVFAPYPLAATAVPSTKRGEVRATGKFVQLKSVTPLEIGARTRHFTNAIANIIPQGEHGLLIYIHYILKTKTYGVTVKTTVTDWGVFIGKDNVVAVEAGKIFGWQDKWAMRFQYSGAKGRPETLYVIFADAGAQVEGVKLLRAMQFSVSTGVVTS